MTSQVLEARLLIPHLLNSLLKLGLLSRICNRPILQVYVVCGGFKVSKLRKLSKLRGQVNADILSRCILLNCSYVVLNCIISLISLMWLPAIVVRIWLFLIVFKDCESFDWVLAKDMTDVLFSQHIHQVFGERLCFRQLFSCALRGNFCCLCLCNCGNLWRCIFIFILLYYMHHIIILLSLIGIVSWFSMPNFRIVRHNLARCFHRTIRLCQLSQMRFLRLVLSDF
jgi:hypothetical protein